MIRNIIKNLIKSSVANIEQISDFKQKNVRAETKKRSEAWVSSGKNKKYLDSLIINFSDKYRVNYYRLREFLDNYYIFSPEVQKSDAKAEVIVEWLFNKLTDNYKLMPLNLRDEVDEAILHKLRKCKDLNKIYKQLKKGQKSVIHFEKITKKQYKEEYEKVHIDDKDIEYLHNTLERVISLLSSFTNVEDGKEDSMKQLVALLNKDTLKTMQLLGFNYKEAIGEPLTEVCSNAIRNTLGSLSSKKNVRNKK